jgi:hypothetical protein
VEEEASMTGSRLRRLAQDGGIALFAGFLSSLIAFLARAYLAVVLSAGVLVCGAVIAGLEIANARRAPLSVKIKGDPQWLSGNEDIRIVAVEIEIRNRTRNTIPIEEYGFAYAYESPAATLESPQLSQGDLDTVELVANYDRYFPPLRRFVEVPGHKAISGWYVAGVRRDRAGGTPKCIISVKDNIGSVYPVIIPPQKPYVYSA